LERGMHAAVGFARDTLRDNLVQAREAAGDVLNLQLSNVRELTQPAPRRPMSFDVGVDYTWGELVTTAIRRWLPVAMRRRRVLRELNEWCRAACLVRSAGLDHPCRTTCGRWSRQQCVRCKHYATTIGPLPRCGHLSCR
jgi:hypothetical protein